jgi:16S rRNA (cytosine1402-N4)-methyltransferase
MNLSSPPPVDGSADLHFDHISVLAEEIVTGLHPQTGGAYLDATAGAGGHSWHLLTAMPHISLTLIDRDPQAIAATRHRLAPFLTQVPPAQIQFWQGNFAHFPGRPQSFDGIIADLGVSSPQLDTQERGFSFRHCAPLDMRMDPHQELTAQTVVNHWSELELAHIFFDYGEERFSRRIAGALVQKRPFYTTTDLAAAIAATVPAKYRYGRIHPATRVFQALRIVVNDELGSLERFLHQAPQWLKPGGYLGIISFHSLEDRRVKHHFRDCLELQVLTKKPILAGAPELERNPRARSAKLRWAQKRPPQEP